MAYKTKAERRAFYYANYAKIDAEDGRQDLIDHITDSIGYKGERRRRFLQRLEKLPFIDLVAVVYRYYERGKVTLPAGWNDGAAPELTGPPVDMRNMRERFIISFRRRQGKIETVRRPRTVPGVSPAYAARAGDCKRENGGDCKGFKCRRLTLTGYCLKWGAYVAERRQVESTAAAF